MPDVIAWTDGSGPPYDKATGRCHGVGGWGVVMIDIHGGYREYSGWEADTTSQRMELTAAMKVFQVGFEQEVKGSLIVEVRTDSSYLKNGVNARWIDQWRRNGWRNSKGDSVSNRDLWERLFLYLEARPRGSYEFVKVKGLAGVDMNERADRLADAARREGLRQQDL